MLRVCQPRYVSCAGSKAVAASRAVFNPSSPRILGNIKIRYLLPLSPGNLHSTRTSTQGDSYQTGLIRRAVGLLFFLPCVSDLKGSSKLVFDSQLPISEAEQLQNLSATQICHYRRFKRRLYISPYRQYLESILTRAERIRP